MKPHHIYLAITVSLLSFNISKASERRIFTYIESASPPTATNFYIDESAADKFADSVAYKPEFTISADQSIQKVKAFLMAKYPSGYDFKVFECTLAWTGISSKAKEILGFQFAFVRSEIALKKDGPDEIIPC
jgi:hypothetical protein